jgi:hypothetical protein
MKLKFGDQYFSLSVHKTRAESAPAVPTTTSHPALSLVTLPTKPERPRDCSQWASTDFRNRGNKANKLGAAERGFLNHPVYKVLWWFEAGVKAS